MKKLLTFITGGLFILALLPLAAGAQPASSPPGGVVDATFNSVTAGSVAATATGGATGVTGVSDSGAGVAGTSSNGYGVFGTSSFASGVRGSGVYGVEGVGGAQGVRGTGTTYGVYGSGPTGAYGIGTNYGLYGSGPTGIFGTGTNYGMYGTGTSIGAYFAQNGGNSVLLGTASYAVDATGGVRSSTAVTAPQYCIGASCITSWDQAVVDNSVVTNSITNNNVTFAKLQDIATDRLLGRDAAGTGDAGEIALDGSLTFTGSNSIQLSGDSATPGNSMLYGTDSSGTKGWYALTGGAASLAFQTINTSSGTDPVADTTADTLNITAGSGITISGDSTTDTVTITSTVVDTNTNASTICNGTTTYLDGDGNCDTIVASSGDITGVTAGSGLTGGGTSGDVTVSVGTGAITSTHIQDNGITTADIAEGTIGAGDLNTNAVDNINLANGAVTSVKIFDGTIQGADILDGTILTGDIGADTIAAADIAAGAVGSSEILDGTITSADISASANIPGSAIAGNSITSLQIGVGEVGASEIANDSVTATDTDSATVQDRVSGTCAAGNAIRVIAAGGTVTCQATSDARVKFDQKPMSMYGLSSILSLQPKEYTFYYDAFFDENGKLNLGENKETSIGLIAQELAEVIPEAVHIPKDDSKELWSIKFNNLFPVLVNAIQELKAQIDADWARNAEEINALKIENSELRARIEALEAKVQ